MSEKLKEIVLKPIGWVKNGVKSTPKPEHDWHGVVSEIVIEPALCAGLEGLERYSHIIVLYWAHKATAPSKMALRVRYKGDPSRPMVGVFASRSPYRPNSICQKVARLLEVNGMVLKVKGLDALDGTPVIDIKPFIPRHDAPQDATVPDWSDL
jgi:tRNA-Thr(GGU) m(6)t(6)A37 methyltransferase TsaA